MTALSVATLTLTSLASGLRSLVLLASVLTAHILTLWCITSKRAHLVHAEELLLLGSTFKATRERPTSTTLLSCARR